MERASSIPAKEVKEAMSRAEEATAASVDSVAPSLAVASPVGATVSQHLKPVAQGSQLSLILQCPSRADLGAEYKSPLLRSLHETACSVSSASPA